MPLDAWAFGWLVCLFVCVLIQVVIMCATKISAQCCITAAFEILLNLGSQTQYFTWFLIYLDWKVVLGSRGATKLQYSVVLCILNWMWIAELHQAFFVVIHFLRPQVSFCNLDNLLNRGNIFLVTWQIKWWDSQFLRPSFLMLFFHLLQDSKCPRLISIMSERSSFSSTQVCHDLLKIGVKEGKGQFLS